MFLNIILYILFQFQMDPCLINNTYIQDHKCFLQLEQHSLQYIIMYNYFLKPFLLMLLQNNNLEHKLNQMMKDMVILEFMYNFVHINLFLNLHNMDTPLDIHQHIIYFHLDQYNTYKYHYILNFLLKVMHNLLNILLHIHYLKQIIMNHKQ